MQKIANEADARTRKVNPETARHESAGLTAAANIGIGWASDARQGLIRAWLVAFVAAAVVFSVFPSIDLFVSSLFYRGGGFIGARSPLLEAVRQSIWTFTLVVGIAALAGSLIAILRDRLLGSTYHLWNIVVAVYLLGPGLAANVLLKSHWGRARPAHLVEFGGTADFTPALLPSDECARNCSFVSGEASGATAAAIAIWLLSAPLPQPWLRRACRAFAIAIAVVGSSLRIVAGRHFLSDVVFAVLIVTGIALFLLRYQPKPASKVENAAE